MPPTAIQPSEALKMVLILTEEYPECVREAKEMIADGEVGMDLVKLIRQYTRLDLAGAVSYRSALLQCKDVL